MNHLINCACGEVIVKSLNSDTKIRGAKIILFKNDLAYAVCKSCNTEVQIPLALDVDMLKSLAQKSPMPLYIRNVYKSS